MPLEFIDKVWRALTRLHWSLCAVLVMAMGFALTAAQLRAAIAPDALAGFNSSLLWASVSGGELDGNLGLRYFSLGQVEFLVRAFPEHRFIAATAVATIAAEIDGEPARPSIQFVSPGAFAVAGVAVDGRAIPAQDAPFCVPSQRWLQAHGQRPGRMRLGQADLSLSGSVDPRFLMFAGVAPVDIWCSWDLVGSYLTVGDRDQAREIPAFWMYVGAADGNAMRQWRERSKAIDMPRPFAMGSEILHLVTLDGWVGHPFIQRAALERLAQMRSLGVLFVSFGFALTLFIAVQRLRRRRHELALRCAIGAQTRHLVWPALHAHLGTLLLSLPAGVALAWSLSRLIWLDASLSEARFSGASIVDVDWRPAVLLCLSLSALSALLDIALALRLSAARLLDVSAKGALLGLGRSRIANAVVIAFAFIALWVVCAQASSTRYPQAGDFGLPNDMLLLKSRFAEGLGPFDVVLKGAQLQQIANATDAALNPSRFAMVEVWPGLAGAIMPGTLKRKDHQECGRAEEMLRGSLGLLTQLSAVFAVGNPPQTRTDIAISESRARRCFGTAELALGASLRMGAEEFDVSGVYRDFDWHLGSGQRSDFVAGLSASTFAYDGVVFGDAPAAQVSQIYLRQLQTIQPKAIAVSSEDVNQIAAQLHAAEVAQARVLAGLGLLLALGCVVASAGLFAAIYAELAPTLALHLALGASSGQLARRALLPLLGIAFLVMLILATLRTGLAERSETVNRVLSADADSMVGAAALTVAMLAGMALWRLGRVLRRPGLAAELHGA